MINYLSGKTILKKEKFIILDVGGIGFKVFLSQKTISKIPQEKSELKLFCYLHVRENVLDLYGFLSYDELDFFQILNDISGIGPKAAIEISSLGPIEKLQKEIELKGEKAFEGIHGLGKKRIQSIILELSGRIKKIKKEKVEDETEEALINLGFPRQRAKEALSKVSAEVKTPEEKIKEALRILGGK